MNCPYCGSVNPEGSTICAACGQSMVVAAPPVAPAPPATPESYSQPPSQTYAPPTYAPPPAPPAAPAGYTQPVYTQPQVVTSVAVKNHLVLAILTTLFCCLPFGVVSIIYATQVNSKLAIGDLAGAQQASKNAALWSWLAIGGAVLLGIVYAAFMVFAVSQSSTSSTF